MHRKPLLFPHISQSLSINSEKCLALATISGILNFYFLFKTVHRLFKKIFLRCKDANNKVTLCLASPRQEFLTRHNSGDSWDLIMGGKGRPYFDLPNMTRLFYGVSPSKTYSVGMACNLQKKSSDKNNKFTIYD